MYHQAQSCHQKIVLKSEAEVKIKSTISNLNDSFAKLLMQIREELKDKSVSEITEHLHDCGYTYLPLEELETCKGIKELLRKLDKCYDFLDCDVLTTLAKQFATPTLFQKFQEHSEAAINFRKSHSVQELRECLQDIFNPHIENLANAPKAHIHLHDAWTKRVINELFILIKRFFPTCDHLALTKVINITCSSVHITYFMSESHDEIEEIILHSKKELAFMKYIGVYGITINNEVILQVTNDEPFSFDVGLLDSSMNGQFDAVKFFLEIGFDSEIQAALVLASHNGHHQVVELIINNYPNILCNDTFLTASSKEFSEVTNRFLQKQLTNLDIYNINKWTLLMTASENGHHQVVKLLLKKKTDPNLQDNNGETALMIASVNGHHQVVKLLLKEKADPNIEHNDGWTALMAASENGHQQVVELLLKEKADPNIQHKNDGWTALMAASENGHQQVVELLLKEKADPNIQHKNGWTALMAASENGHQQVVELLLKGKADPNIQHKNGWTALMAASEKGHQQVVELLLKERADPNIQVENGWTALMAASENGHQQVAELLLKEKADPNIQHKNGWTALMEASEKGHQQVAELLLKEKADPNIQHKNGWTALMAASENGHQQVVELLLKEKADPNIQHKNGWTALMAASENGHQQVVELLLKEKADPNIQDSNNHTALMVASHNGHQQVVEILLKEKADPNIQDNDGETALVAASENGHHQVVDRRTQGDKLVNDNEKGYHNVGSKKSLSMQLKEPIAKIKNSLYDSIRGRFSIFKKQKRKS